MHNPDIGTRLELPVVIPMRVRFYIGLLSVLTKLGMMLVCIGLVMLLLMTHVRSLL